MKNILTWTFMLVLMFSLAGCGDKSPATGKESSEVAKGASSNNGTATGASSSPGTAKGDEGKELILPDNYPKEILPLAADAEILDIRQHPANNGLEVDYVSANDIDTLCDYYEGALKEAEHLSTAEMPDGYMVTARIEGVSYTIMLSEGIMDHIPRYADKVTVSIVINRLKGIASEKPNLPEGEGKSWPTAELPGIPELTGYISQIQREDDMVRLEIIVEDSGVVTSYIEKLKEVGFSPDTEPDVQSGHVEFLAFKDSSIINFSYKGEEQLVFIEYQ